MASMQFSAHFYLVFSLTLVVLFLFGCVYAYGIRRMANNNVQGQTAYTVVVGVGVTVVVSSLVIGTDAALVLLACFAASGIPMVLEYAQRTHAEQKRDHQDAKSIAKDLLG